MILIDTCCWIEYFLGSKTGKIVEKYLNENETATPSIVLIELSCKSAKENWDFEEYFNFIKSKSSIIGLNNKMILKCGEIYVKERKKKPSFGIVDAMILTAAIETKAKILTIDNHYKNLDEAIILS